MLAPIQRVNKYLNYLLLDREETDVSLRSLNAA